MSGKHLAGLRSVVSLPNERHPQALQVNAYLMGSSGFDAHREKLELTGFIEHLKRADGVLSFGVNLHETRRR